MRQHKLFKFSNLDQAYIRICGRVAPFGGVCELQHEHEGTVHMRAWIEGDHVPPPGPNQDVLVSWVA